MTESLQQRLLRIQMTLEQWDEHNPDCACSYCDAIQMLSEIRSELRTADIQQQRAVA